MTAPEPYYDDGQRTDPRLLSALRDLGGEWGPLGVAIVATSLTDRDALIRATNPHGIPEPEEEEGDTR